MAAASDLGIELTVGASVLVAVGGWLVNQWRERHGLRRTMRVQYLLDAYRRLERAQNRDMTREVADELEAALADIQLLGSPRQVGLAVAFIKEFAEKRNASAEELMQDLRRSLRQELLLDPVPPARMWLRIEPDQLTSTDTSAVWLSALAMTEQSTHELAKRLAPPSSNGSASSEGHSWAEHCPARRARLPSTPDRRQALRFDQGAERDVIARGDGTGRPRSEEGRRVRRLHRSDALRDRTRGECDKPMKTHGLCREHASRRRAALVGAYRLRHDGIAWSDGTRSGATTRNASEVLVATWSDPECHGK